MAIAIYKENTTTERLFPFNPYIVNKVYKTNDNIYVYKNSKGYIHILQPKRIMFDGRLINFQIYDYILNKDTETYKFSKSYGNFKTFDESLQELENRKDDFK